VNTDTKYASGLDLIFGGWLIVAPLALAYPPESAMIEDMIAGMVLIVSGLSPSDPRRPTTTQPWIAMSLGLWIVAAPWVLGYATRVRSAALNDIVVGSLIALFAMIRIVIARPVANRQSFRR
jgi:hypothetical protein